MKTTSMLATAIFAAMFSAPAFAASLTLTDVAGIWSSSSPQVDGLGSREIRWGTPAGAGQSGYNFSSSETPFTVQDQTEFVIGTFSHENYPIIGTSLESADLSVSFSVLGVSGPITSTFSFLHNETRNDGIGGICANGQRLSSSLNSAGCADHVTATLNRGQSEAFSIDGESYVLDILGFRRGGATLTDFWTRENQSNSAELIASFRVVDLELDPPLSEVPLPASGLLLFGALAAFAVGRKRK